MKKRIFGLDPILVCDMSVLAMSQKENMYTFIVEILMLTRASGNSL